MLKKDTVVCVIGLGYVGLPLAEALAPSLKVIGFDTNTDLVKELNPSNNSQNLTIIDDTQ